MTVTETSRPTNPRKGIGQTITDLKRAGKTLRAYMDHEPVEMCAMAEAEEAIESALVELRHHARFLSQL